MRLVVKRGTSFDGQARPEDAARPAAKMEEGMGWDNATSHATPRHGIPGIEELFPEELAAMKKAEDEERKKAEKAVRERKILVEAENRKQERKEA